MYRKISGLLLAGTMMFGSLPVPVASAAAISPTIVLDGAALSFDVNPIIENGATLVPMRKIFEAQGATVRWEPQTRTVTARKDDLFLTYQIGEKTINTNNGTFQLEVPGRIQNDSTLVPLRFISETLGSSVTWHAATRTVTITSPGTYASVQWGVNLRKAPNTNQDSSIIRMLRKGEEFEVIQEIDALWLEVRTMDGVTGFISAKPKYTDYTSAAIADGQADLLISLGEQFLGTPYEFGAKTGQTETFDCSSFMHYLFQNVLSIDLPRTSYNQAKVGEEVSLDELRKGDLLFFSARGLNIGHVGIYAGDNQILHTFSKKDGVRYNELSESWMDRFVTARRIL